MFPSYRLRIVVVALTAISLVAVAQKLPGPQGPTAGRLTRAATEGNTVTRATSITACAWSLFAIRSLRSSPSKRTTWLAATRPPGFPGMAHAQEHMAFRGCPDLTADQIAAIFAQLGGAITPILSRTSLSTIETVPAADLDIALRVDADCMQDIQDSQTEWAQEKGAIEQEVARDLSNPTYKFITRAE